MLRKNSYTSPRMGPRKYPLDVLVKLRDEKVNEASQALAARVSAREQSEQRRIAAERSERSHVDESAAVRDAEQAALARGELTAADLQRGQTWELRVREERDGLARVTEQARSRESAARAAEQAAQGAVAERKADAEVVAKDRSRWVESEKKIIEAKDEEAAEDVFRSRQR